MYPTAVVRTRPVAVLSGRRRHSVPDSSEWTAEVRTRQHCVPDSSGSSDSRCANTSTFHLPHLPFYTVANVCFPHIHALIFHCFTYTCRNALLSYLVPIGTDAISALCTGVTYLMYRLSTHGVRNILHTGYELFSTWFLKLETFQHLVSLPSNFSTLRHWFVLLIYYSSEHHTSE